MSEHVGTKSQVAGLQAHAAAKREDTVHRVQGAIEELITAQRPVTAAAIERLTGIGFTALKRNKEAYAAFVQHSARLRAQREGGTRPRSRGVSRGATTVKSGSEQAVSPYDPLLHRKKSWLVQHLRAARAAHDQLHVQYQALLQAYMQLQADLRREGSND